MVLTTALSKPPVQARLSSMVLSAAQGHCCVLEQDKGEY